MKLLFAFLAFSLAVSTGEAQIYPFWFSQCMDHEGDPLCIQQWQQRYWVKNDTYEEGGPVFFWLGGEWDAESDLSRFQMNEYAKTYGALQVALEHRFYGQSFPHTDFTAAGLRVHTSRQAIADAARFEDEFKLEHPETADVPWVVFGCSYSANMAAYFKLKYPDHAKTAVASSGPVKAVYDYPDHINTTFTVMRETDPECHSIMGEAFACFNTIKEGGSCHGYSSFEEIYDLMPLCLDFDMDPDLFYVWIIASFWLDNSPTTQINEYCPLFKQLDAANPVDQYAAFIRENLEYPDDCEKRSWTSLMKELRGRFRKREAERRGLPFATEDDTWTWQTCNEFGYFQSSGGIAGNLWGPEMWSEYCTSEWGISQAEVMRRIDETNEFYGGTDMDVGCVQFIQGSWDPWKHAGVYRTDQTNSGNTVLVIEQAQHCYDVRTQQGPPVSNAQQFIQTRIGVYMNSNVC